MRVLVCGGRDYKDWSTLYRTLDAIPNISCIIHGAAKGADSIAEDWAYRGRRTMGSAIEIRRFPADWGIHGKAAGYIRNRKMLAEGKPDLVVAFPGGRGTANMVQLAREAGVKVIENGHML